MVESLGKNSSRTRKRLCVEEYSLLMREGTRASAGPFRVCVGCAPCKADAPAQESFSYS